MSIHFIPKKSSVWLDYIVLLLLGIVSFGILAGRLGFYWDDWPLILVHRVQGLGGYWAYYAADRPLCAWTHILFTPILGDSAWRWQAFSLLLRWLSAAGLMWTLSFVWPRNRLLPFFAASLFMVYPVFTMQAIAVTFHRQWLQFALYFLSVGLSLRALSAGKWRWGLIAVAILAMFMELTITEYFIGMELLRPVLVWLALDPATNRIKRIKRTLRESMPFLLLLVLFITWRLFLLKLPDDDPNKAVLLYQFLVHPWQTLQNFFGVAWRDLLEVVISVWNKTLNPNLFSSQQTRFEIFSWSAGIATAGGLAFFIWWKDYKPAIREEEEAPGIQPVLIGLLAVLLGLAPAWAAGRQVLEDSLSSRFSLPAIFGASIVLIGTILWVAERRARRVVLLSLLVGLAVAFNLRVMNDYRWEWNNQLRFYWQLAWRAPQIKPGTAILSINEPLDDQGLFSTSSAVNLLYGRPHAVDKLPFWVYSLLPRYKNGAPQPLQLGFDTSFRSLRFQGRTPNSLVIQYDPSQGNCLWVLNLGDVDDPDVPQTTKEFLKVSNLSRILPAGNEGEYPPRDLFGAPPWQDWCYFYEKADLSRQQKDWAKVFELGGQAIVKSFNPANPSSNSPHEWVPFLEAYVALGRWEDAARLTLALGAKGQRYSPWLCGKWEMWKNDSGNQPTPAAYAQVTKTLNCSHLP